MADQGEGYSGYAVKGAILGRFIAGNIREKVGVCFVLDISCSSLQKLTEHRYMYMQCVESVSLIYRNFPEQVRYTHMSTSSCETVGAFTLTYFDFSTTKKINKNLGLVIA